MPQTGRIMPQIRTSQSGARSPRVAGNWVPGRQSSFWFADSCSLCVSWHGQEERERERERVNTLFSFFQNSNPDMRSSLQLLLSISSMGVRAPTKVWRDMTSSLQYGHPEDEREQRLWGQWCGVTGSINVTCYDSCWAWQKPWHCI